MDYKTKKETENLWTMVAVLLFIVLVVAGYLFKSNLSQSITESAPLDPNCDLRQGACTSKLLTGGGVQFSITPDSLPILRPLKLTVSINDIKVKAISVDFIGLGMDMGYNRFILDKINKTTFTGKAIIPVCVRSKMDWEAVVLLQTDNGLIRVPFRFYTLK
ncbi:MAG: hypothetical protein KAG28_00920 [Cocleimonas sp.]|nr:hypothetical protein [Cocleimonas sp.]